MIANDIGKSQEVKNFIAKLYSMEYTIDSKAKNIKLENNDTLSHALTNVLQEFQAAESLMFTPPSGVIVSAHNMITAAFVHGVVIDKNDIGKKLKQTEELLTRCEDEKAKLERDNNDMRKELIRCQQIKEAMQEQLLSHSQTDRDDKP
jgi:hypothetical protein